MGDEIYRYMVKYVKIISFLFFGLTLNAQTPSLQWSKSFGGSDADEIRGCELDHQSNIISVGYFTNTVDLDPGAGSFTVSGQAAGVSQMFVQKLDSNGSFLWAKTWTSTSEVIGRAIAVDPNGDMYVSGTFKGASLDMDPGGGVSTLSKTSGDAANAFILKLDALGNFKWAIGHSGGVDIERLKLNAQGKLFVAGNYYAAFDLDPDPLVTNRINSPNIVNCFMERIDTSGVQDWVGIVRSALSVRAFGLNLINDNEPLLVGEYEGWVDFDPSSAIVNLPLQTSGQTFGYVLQWDSTGVYKNVMGLQGTGNSALFEVQVDAQQNLILAGSHENAVDFDPTSSVQMMNSTSEGWFVSKMDTTGNLSWVSAFDNPVAALFKGALHINLNQNGSFYLAGDFLTSVDFEPGKSNGVSINGVSNRDIFISHFQPNGQVNWASAFATSKSDKPLGLLKDQNGSLFLAGYFSDPISFDPYNSTITNTTNGDEDAFVLKLGGCGQGVDSIVQIEACDSYFRNNSYFYNDTIIHVDTILTKRGCDSIIVMEDVEVNSFTQKINRNFTTGRLSWQSTSIPGQGFQWYRCDLDSIVVGAIGNVHHPSQNGVYALIVTQKGCVDTSNCLVVDYVSINEYALRKIDIYPNPVSDVLTVKGQEQQLFHLEVLDMTGRILLESFDTNQLNVSKLSRGSYLVRISQKGWTEVRKVEKL